MDKKLIFVDIDETLFSKKTLSVPDSAKSSLKKAQENGHKIFINTGRPYSYLNKELKDIGFDGYLCSNGCDIRVDGKQIYYEPIPHDACVKLKDIALKHNIEGALQGAKCVYFKDDNKEYNAYLTGLKEDFIREPYMPHTFTWDNIDQYEKGLLFFRPESDYESFYKDVKDNIDYDFEIVKIDDSQYEYVPKNHSKATAIKGTVDYYDSKIENCYAFGDSNNDKEMIEYAGVGIAMGNSSKLILDLADYITTDILDDGIKNALEYFKLI